VGWKMLCGIVKVGNFNNCESVDLKTLLLLIKPVENWG